MSTMTSVQLDLRDIATNVIERAMKLGATAAECVARDGSEFSTVVRLGEVETLKESGSKALGVRVFMGDRTANTSTSDLSPEGVESMIKGAIELAKISGDLDLYYDDVYSLSTADRIDYARRAEKAATSADARIKNSEGGSFDAATGRKVF